MRWGGVGWVMRWGGVGWNGVGGVGGGNKFGSNHDTHTMAHATLVGHRGSGSNPRSPPPNCCPPLVPLFQSWFWKVGKMLFGKADWLTFNT